MKIIKILEKMWLLLAIVTFVLAIYKLIIGAHGDALYFIVFCAVSVVFYLLRRRQRRHFDETTQEQKDIEQ